jgi:propionate CoA-transferase
MSKIISADKAAELIQDGVTLGSCLMGLAGWPEEIAKAIEKRFLETGHPKDLTVISSSGAGDSKERGVTRLGYEGLTKRWIAGHMGQAPKMKQLVQDNKIEAYNFPQGVIVQLWREIAAKRPGLITTVGLGTFIDPRIEGGKMNPKTVEDLIKIIEIDDKEYMFYKSFPVNVAIIRGSVGDENGNLTMDKEGLLIEALPLAQATKNSGGIVIAQVETVAKAGTLHPKKVKVPGILVDYIVPITDKENHYQTEGLYFHPSFAGDVKIPLSSIPPVPLSERKIIARRAAMELIPDAIVNLGIGVSSDVAAVAAEEKASHLMHLTTESGTIGGIPASPPNFGHAYNPEAVVEHHAQFDFYDGGGIDIAFLGLAQADKEGNINVTKFSNRVVGSGGFINISQNCKKVVYCGTFTAGGLEIAVEDNKLKILNEGRMQKFVDTVDQITYSGKYAQKVNQPAIYVTERAVFELQEGGIVLTEIAPGVDLDKDILAQMKFKPKIAEKLKIMDPNIFSETWGGLEEIILGKNK